MDQQEVITREIRQLIKSCELVFTGQPCLGMHTLMFADVNNARDLLRENPGQPPHYKLWQWKNHSNNGVWM